MVLLQGTGSLSPFSEGVSVAKSLLQACQLLQDLQRLHLPTECFLPSEHEVTLPNSFVQACKLMGDLQRLHLPPETLWVCSPLTRALHTLQLSCWHLHGTEPPNLTNFLILR